MATETTGTIAALWRYPVKSMRGEELDVAIVTDRGLDGDRAYALVDVETGKVVSAKNPRKWPDLLEFQSVLLPKYDEARSSLAAQVTLLDGGSIHTDDPDFDAQISARLGRAVRLASSAGDAPRIEGYWPDFDFVESPDSVFEVKLPPGTFFDAAVVHLVTTATLRKFQASRPESRFDLARFRPNIVVEWEGDGFPEDGWAGRTIRIGDEVCLSIDEPCPRCVMTTVGQGGLPKDPDVLRTIVRENGGNLGVLASVRRGGTVRRGDAVTVE